MEEKIYLGSADTAYRKAQEELDLMLKLAPAKRDKAKLDHLLNRTFVLGKLFDDENTTAVTVSIDD